jgi:hypothetical protein
MEKIETTGKSCRVQVPVKAQEFLDRQNEINRNSNTRLFSIANVLEAMIESAITGQDWKSILMKLQDTFRPLGPRARQKKVNRV